MCVIHGGSMHQHLPETVGFEEHGGWDGEVTEHGKFDYWRHSSKCNNG